MSQARRVLLLSSSTGSGHDMRARAITAWIDQIHGNSVTVRTEQIIENSSLLGRFGVWVYNTIQRHLPWLHNIYFFIVEFVVASHRGRVGFGGAYYRQLLRNFQPDLILSLHDSTNRGYFEDARRVLGSSVRCATYCGEFSGGFGYSRNWINPSADHFFARTHKARDFAVQQGMPRQRTDVFRTLLPPEAFSSRISREQKNHLLAELNLQPDRFTLFMATGGYGANHHLPFLKAILPLFPEIQIIMVCGRNQSAHRRLKSFLNDHPQLPVHLEGFSSRIHAYLQLAHAVLTRGGANTTMEALHFQCPLLYDAMGGLMPQERCTTRFVLQHRAGHLLRRPRDLRQRLKEWIPMNGEYQKVRLALRSMAVPENPADFLHSLLNNSPLSCSKPLSDKTRDS